MQRIVLPVDDKVALFWHKATPEQRLQVIRLFSWLVENNELGPFTKEDFKRLLDGMSDKAMERGLTPEILEEILNEP